MPSAATWQVTPGGQVPSRIAAMPRPRPESRMPRSRWRGRDQWWRSARQPGPASAGVPGASPVRRRRRVAPVARAMAQRQGFHFIERRVSVARTADAGDLGRFLAGEQPGGVGCGDDDRGSHPGRGAWAWASRAGEDRAGGGGCAGAGQAEAAEGSDVERRPRWSPRTPSGIGPGSRAGGAPVPAGGDVLAGPGVSGCGAGRLPGTASPCWPGPGPVSS